MGKCVNKPGEYECECWAGFVGPDCFWSDVPCRSLPCANDFGGNGVCKIIGLEIYVCDCPPGYTGVFCEKEIDECDSNPCKFGQCTDGFIEFDCACNPGYQGTLCNSEINECESYPCQNEATCHDEISVYTCECNDFFEGDHCEQDINECKFEPCNEKNSGVCINTHGDFNCDCFDTGFEGEFCELEIDTCLTFPCYTGTTCKHVGPKAYKCTCPFGFLGDRCDNPLILLICIVFLVGVPCGGVGGVLWMRHEGAEGKKKKVKSDFKNGVKCVNGVKGVKGDKIGKGKAARKRKRKQRVYED